MNKTLLATSVAIIKSAIINKLETLKTTEDKARLIFETILHKNVIWYDVEPEDQFRIGVATLMIMSSEEEKARIEEELKLTNMLNAAMSGVHVDLDELSELVDRSNPIGLVGIFEGIRTS